MEKIHLDRRTREALKASQTEFKGIEEVGRGNFIANLEMSVPLNGGGQLPVEIIDVRGVKAGYTFEPDFTPAQVNYWMKAQKRYDEGDPTMAAEALNSSPTLYKTESGKRYWQKKYGNPSEIG